jgi:hypothetical protein
MNFELGRTPFLCVVTFVSDRIRFVRFYVPFVSGKGSEDSLRLNLTFHIQ